ncbi:MAG: hypothetical protein SXU28_10045 [Pseudomonadota bacterium]|nr:hypothetical protein [Pseudomonadota bacterium]
MKPEFGYHDRPEVRAALEKLGSELQKTGYDAAEVEAIVGGAREHVEDLLAGEPNVSNGELEELISGFSDPEIEPSLPPTAKSFSLVGAAALASGIMGILIMIAAFTAKDPDLGGALMLLGTFLGGGLACLLGVLSRRTTTGLIAMVIGAALWLSLLAFLLLA